MKPTKIIIIMVTLLFISSSIFTIPRISAENGIFDSSLSKIKINKVEHTVELLEGGLIIVNDTLTVSSLNSSQTIKLKGFPIGLPYDFAQYLIKCFAYDHEAQREIPVVLDYGLGKAGFYGVLVNFTETGGFEVGSNPKKFSVTFIFSGPVNASSQSIGISFALYPSLTVNAEVCNSTIIFPTSLTLDYASFTFQGNYSSGGKRFYYTSAMPLESFTYQKASMNLTISGDFSYIEVEKLEREIILDEWGNINVKDFYKIRNKAAQTADKMTIYFPEEAYDYIVENEIGMKIPEAKIYRDKNKLSLPTISPNETETFILLYKLEPKNFIIESDGIFKFNLSVGKITSSLIKELVVSVVFPQGSQLESSDILLSASKVERKVSRETLTFVFKDFSPFDSFQTEISYRFNIFWSSYPFTLVTCISIAAVLLVAFAWKRPVSVPVTVPKAVVSPRVFRRFVEGYEERIKILSKLERLETQTRRGKVSRRDYKVRKRMLENRLSSLSKDLSSLRERIRSSGPRYASIIRQLEVAEAQLEEAEAGIRRIRTRYRRGEISREAYRRLLNEHEKRKEEAHLLIEGALLRLREEFH